MKIYIRSSEQMGELANEYVVDVYYDVPDESVWSVISAGITPVAWGDNRVDEQALADYDAFVDNVYAALCAFFDVVDIEESNRSDTSWYFWLYAKNNDGDVATKFIIRLRLSDHEYPARHRVQDEKAYVEKKAQTYKRPAEKKFQEWKIKNITVNGKKYSSYDEAEDAIYDELEAYSKKMYNKGN
ncbi:MAG: hypothetical protein NC320_01970 [Clostridium sp.]|nr:hypothetical protein [Clostridium sp.]